MSASMARYPKQNFEVVKLLIESKADVNFQNEMGLTALMLSAGVPDNDGLENIMFLVENGADVNLKMPKPPEMDARDMAKRPGNQEVIKYLDDQVAKQTQMEKSLDEDIAKVKAQAGD